MEVLDGFTNLLAVLNWVSLDDDAELRSAVSDLAGAYRDWYVEKPYIGLKLATRHYILCHDAGLTSGEAHACYALGKLAVYFSGFDNFDEGLSCSKQHRPYTPRPMINSGWRTLICV